MTTLSKPYKEENPHAAHQDGLDARKLIEFVLQRPLEALEERDRERFLNGLRDKLLEQNNHLYIDNIVQVVTPPNIDSLTSRALDRAVADAQSRLASPGLAA